MYFLFCLEKEKSELTETATCQVAWDDKISWQISGGGVSIGSDLSQSWKFLDLYTHSQVVPEYVEMTTLSFFILRKLISIFSSEKKYLSSQFTFWHG